MTRRPVTGIGVALGTLLGLTSAASLAAPRVSLEELAIKSDTSSLPEGAVVRFGFKDTEQGSGIKALAVSPDGQRTATSGYLAGAPIKVRQFGTRDLFLELADDTHGSGSLAYSPDGTRLAAGSNSDGTVRLWDAITGERLALLRTADYPQFSTNLVTYVAFAPDGESLVSASPIGTIEIWDLDQEMVTASVAPAADAKEKHKKLFQAIAIAPDGKLLAVATADGVLRIYDFPALRLRDQVAVAPLRLTAIAFSPDSRLMAYIGNVTGANFQPGDGAHVYDLEAKQELRNLAADHGDQQVVGYGHAAGFSPDGRLLATLSITRNLHLWNVATGELVRTIPVSAMFMSWAPDGSSIVTGDLEGRIKYWRVDDGLELHALPGTTEPRPVLPSIRSVALPSDESIALTSTATGEIHVWDRQTGAWLRALPDPPRTPLSGVSGGLFFPDASQVLFGIRGVIEILDATTGESREWSEYPQADHAARFQSGGMSDTSFSSDGSIVSTLNLERGIYSAGMLRLWDAAEGKLRATIPVEKEMQVQTALSPDGTTLFAVERRRHTPYEYETKIQLYDTSTGKPLRRFPEVQNLWMQTPAVSPDGKLLALGRFGDAVELWDIEQGKLARRLQGPLSGAGIIRTWFSPDGARLAASVSLRGAVDIYGEAVQVWDVASGRVTHQFDVQTRLMAFSPDGRQLAVVGRDNSGIVYDLTQERPEWSGAPLVASEEALELAYQQIGGGPYGYMNQLERYDLCSEMAAGGDATIEFLRPKLLSSFDAERDELYRWIEKLGSDDPAERRAAVEKMGSLGDDFWKAVSGARMEPLSRLQQARIKLAAQKIPEQRRMRVIIHVVRQIGTPAARDLLEEIIATHEKDRKQRQVVERARQMLDQLEQTDG